MFLRLKLNRSGVLFALAACIAASPLAGSAAADATTNVEISKFNFGPREITIAPGTKVRWVNHDEVPHSVASAPGQEKMIASKAMDTDDRYELAFSKEGDYAYYCTVHPFMTGVVHVHKP